MVDKKPLIYVEDILEMVRDTARDKGSIPSIRDTLAHLDETGVYPNPPPSFLYRIADRLPASTRTNTPEHNRKAAALNDSAGVIGAVLIHNIDVVPPVWEIWVEGRNGGVMIGTVPEEVTQGAFSVAEFLDNTSSIQPR